MRYFCFTDVLRFDIILLVFIFYVCGALIFSQMDLFNVMIQF